MQRLNELLSGNREEDRVPRALIRGLMRASDAAVFVVNERDEVLDCNELAGQLSGKPASHGTPIDHVITPRQGGRPFAASELIHRARQRNEDMVFASDIEVQTAQGVSSGAEIAITLCDDCVLVSVRFPSDNRPAWREIQSMQRAHSVSRAAVGLAHDLNNSATALISHVSDMERVIGSADSIANAQAALRRIRHTALQLERFAGTVPGDATSAGDGESQMSAAVLDEMIQDTVALAINGTGVQTSFAYENDLPPVSIPAEVFSQALFNVLVNAVDAMDGAGLLHIEVAAHDARSRVYVTVRDEGHGMDPRLLDRVLQPYFTTREHGMGMGLTVTLSLLQAHGGRLEIDTEPGFGTTVRLELPVVGRENAAAPLGAGAQPSGRMADNANDQVRAWSDERVLLVEDDPLVRRSMQRTLETIGCNVEAVSSGDRAITLFQERLATDQPFSLLITDLTMPGRNDGVQLLRRIRELDPDIPAVLSSGALHRSNAASYREAGFQFVLRKPFGEAEMRRALAEAVRHERDG